MILILDNFQKTKFYAEHKIDDTIDGNCKKIFCQKLIQIINVISRICCTLKLLVGDLSRYASNDTSLQIERFYDDYSAKYRKLRELESKIVCDQNLTQ